MNGNTYYWCPFDGAFYVAVTDADDFIGFAFSAAYHPDEKDYQIMLHIGTMALAIGWQFGEYNE